MNNEWSQREEILSATHRWPVIMAFGLAGILLGFAAAFIWPSTHQATRELYVGLNVYQIEGDQGVSGISNPQFILVDDYKNWQMANLNSLVYMDDILDETLSSLQSQDEYWRQVDREQLAGMLHAYWRNAGKWRLVGEHPEALYASQAVNAWGDVVIESVHAAVAAARDSMFLDLHIRAILESQVQATAQVAAYEQHLESLGNWRARIGEIPLDQSLEEATREQLRESSKLVNIEAGLAQLLDAFPPSGSHADAYLTWLDQAILELNLKIQALHAQIEALDNEKDVLVSQYATASQDSMGLSANLVMETISNSPPKMSVERPTGVLVFIGGMLGLITWGIIWIAKIAQRKNTSNGLVRDPDAP